MDNNKPLMRFPSHIQGKNAKVAIYQNRVEWTLPGRLSFWRCSLAFFTIGLSLPFTGWFRTRAGTEMMPIKNIGSIITYRTGLIYTTVRIIGSGNWIDFTMTHKNADQARTMLQWLMLED